jgi:glycosyltransferase involved in cell wall biosynthesis
MTRASPSDGRIGVLTLARDVGTCYGGAERVAFEFAKRLDPDRFRSHVCVAHAPPTERRASNEADLAELEGLGVEVLRLERHSPLSNLAWGRLYRLLAGDGIEVLHSHMPRASVPGTIIGRLARTPVIVSHEHTWSFEGQLVRRFLDRNVVARGSDLVLAVSERDRQRMIALEGMPPEVVRVLPNGIPHVPEEGPDLRAELGAREGELLIGSVGRFYPQKGYEHLIRAVSILKRGYPGKFRCVVVGHGPEQERLQTLIDELGLADQMQLVGRREDIADVVRAFDVAVLPSNYEGSPLTVLEYMAGAAPIVASGVGGVPELIEDSVHGLLVAPGDTEALASSMRRLLEDRDLARRLGRAARERQLANFDLSVVVGQLQDMYVELLGASSGAAPASRGAAPAGAL